MKVELSNISRKFLKKCQKEDASRIIKMIEELSKDPFHSNSIKLGGDKNKTFRIRVGKYRIIYQLNYGNDCLLITEIGKRQNI